MKKVFDAGISGLILGFSLIVATPLLAAEPLLNQQLDCLIEPRITIKLGAEVAGLISSVEVDRGDLIRTGQVLAKLKSGVEEANFALAKAKAENDLQIKTNQARAEFLRRKASRQAELRLRAAVAESTSDEASTDAAMGEFAAKEAELNFQVAQLEVTHQEELRKQRTIMSPINGVVMERVLSAGEYTNETKHILTIAQIDPLNVEVFVPIAYYGQIAVGSQADVFPESPIGGRYFATVTVVDHVLDAASGTFGVRLELPNPEYAIPAGVNCKIAFSNVISGMGAASRPPSKKSEGPAKPESEAKAEHAVSDEAAKLIEGALARGDQRHVSAKAAVMDKASETTASPEKAAADEIVTKAIADKAGAEVAAAAAAVPEKQVIEATAPEEEPASERRGTELAAPQTIEQETIATLSPDQNNAQAAIDLARALQQELQRVGCNTDALDGNWSDTSQRALERFSQYAAVKIDARLASREALDAVKARTGRVCPLICQSGYRADNDRCVKVACNTGYQVGRKGNCEQVRAKRRVLTGDTGLRRDRPEPATAAQLEAWQTRALAAPPSNAGKPVSDQKAPNHPGQRKVGPISPSAGR
jgi:RND family efflux transporter MFP subunit